MDADVKQIKIQMAQHLGAGLKYGVLGGFGVLIYMVPLVPWVPYAIAALGVLSWWFFVASYNLACRLTNERTLEEFIKSLDEGTLSDIDGLRESEDDEE